MDRLSFLGARCPANMRLRTLTMPPGDAIDYRPGEWLDTMVIVECGELEVECASGRRHRFAAGSIVVLESVPLRRLRNPGREPLVLSALSRASRR
jgi:hypothetical protein